MQGRLVPPVDGRFQCFPRENWDAEFPRAAQAGLACIEWIYDAYGADLNPLASAKGLQEIQARTARYGVQIRSVCADYFMDKPLLRVAPAERQERLQTLLWLLERCCKGGITRVVLPFVDASKIDTDEDLDLVVSSLTAALPVAEWTGVELHLETSLAPWRFAELLDRLCHPLVRVNYDSGNSASLGYDSAEEFAAYGNRIGSVHIKDRVRGGSTVPLGRGDVDFLALFAGLEKGGYRGDFILQVARGTPGDEVEWARQNRAFVLEHLARREPASITDPHGVLR
jgi:hexulose-6-phosphate isomerase